MDEAQQRLEAAVAIDPAFAEAYQQLASIMGFRQLARPRREYLRKASQHADRLSERRQLLLKVQLAQDAGNFAEAEGAVDELLAKFPDVYAGYLTASVLHTPRPGRRGNLPKLLRILSAGVTVLPNTPGTHNIYGYALLEAGRYPEAIREFETFVALAPREPNPYDSLGDGLPARWRGGQGHRLLFAGAHNRSDLSRVPQWTRVEPGCSGTLRRGDRRDAHYPVFQGVHPRARRQVQRRSEGDGYKHSGSRAERGRFGADMAALRIVDAGDRTRGVSTRAGRYSVGPGDTWPACPRNGGGWPFDSRIC